MKKALAVILLVIFVLVALGARNLLRDGYPIAAAIYVTIVAFVLHLLIKYDLKKKKKIL